MIDQAISNYLRHLKYVRGGAKNTIMAYRTDLLQFKQVLKHSAAVKLPGVGLKKYHLEPYLEWLESKDYQPSTVSRKLAALRSFITYLQEEEGLDRDGFLEKLELPSDQRRKPKALTPGEIKQLMAAPAAGTSARDIRDAAIIAFLYATGLKAAEAVRVEVGDLDLRRGLLDRPYAEIDPLPLGVSYHAVERYVKEGRPQLLRDRGEQVLFLNQRGTGLTRQGLVAGCKAMGEGLQSARRCITIHITPFINSTLTPRRKAPQRSTKALRAFQRECHPTPPGSSIGTRIRKGRFNAVR